MLAFTPILMRGDFDPLQIAIVVLFLIGSFVKWLWENWQAKRSGGMPEDLESESLREDARRRDGPPVSPPLTPAAPSPLDEWRRAWKEIQEAARPAQPAPPPPPARRSAAPPPLRQQRRPAASAAQTATVSAPPATLKVAPPQPAAVSPQAGVAANTTLLRALQQLRRDPALMRQAILMREILGPPKALQTSADPAI